MCVCVCVCVCARACVCARVRVCVCAIECWLARSPCSYPAHEQSDDYDSAEGEDGDDDERLCEAGGLPDASTQRCEPAAGARAGDNKGLDRDQMSKWVGTGGTSPDCLSIPAVNAGGQGTGREGTGAANMVERGGGKQGSVTKETSAAAGGRRSSNPWLLVRQVRPQDASRPCLSSIPCLL